MPKAMNIIGNRFGRLTVIRRVDTGSCGRSYWECECDCGGVAVIKGKTLRSGSTKSCGCLHIEVATAQAISRTKPVGHRTLHKHRGRMRIKTDRGFVDEHIYVMEQHLGRRLRKGEVVHHNDHDKSNNDISNLEVMSHAEHTRLHNVGRKLSESAKTAIGKANRRYTTEDARRLREMVASGESQRSAAASLNMSAMVASRIIRGLIYKESSHGVA